MEGWYDDRNNLADLWRWLEEQMPGQNGDAASFMEEPWKWTPEWEQFIQASWRRAWGDDADVSEKGEQSDA